MKDVQIPYTSEDIHRMTWSATVNDLLQSIALEETAVSKLLASVAMKIEAFTGEQRDFPSQPSTQEIILFNHTINKTLDALLMTKWLLYRKLDTIVQMGFDEVKADEGPLMDIQWESNVPDDLEVSEDKWMGDDVLVENQKGETDTFEGALVAEDEEDEEDFGLYW